VAIQKPQWLPRHFESHTTAQARSLKRFHKLSNSVTDFGSTSEGVTTKLVVTPSAACTQRPERSKRNTAAVFIPDVLAPTLRQAGTMTFNLPIKARPGVAMQPVC
jgi:hypothetical protein